ncbi:hypothetical protein TNCV_1391431 [Trichonephila clavipes]|nr:hypothetical protein TNCV_1391431 [Trichonephila clavipes]
MGCRLSFTIMAASLNVVTPRFHTINNGHMATCTGHFTAGEAIKFSQSMGVSSQQSKTSTCHTAGEAIKLIMNRRMGIHNNQRRHNGMTYN